MSSRPSTFVHTVQGPVRLYSTAELLTMPPPTWLIDSILPEGGLVALYGPPGCGKSFVAIDMAMCIATGLPWQGHPVQRGHVVYISAEGGTGIGKRALAWLTHHDIKPEEAWMSWLIEPIPITAESEQMAVLINRIVNELEVSPAMVFVDTLARCFGDGDENQQQDMNRFIAGVDEIRHTCNTTVGVIHHTNAFGTRERGNTAFRGATDTMIQVEGIETDDQHTLTCTKQKDSEHFDPIQLERKKVEGTDSCILVTSDATSRLEQDILTAIDALKRIEPAHWFDWQKESTIGASRFQKCFTVLKARDWVEKAEGEGWRAR